MKIISIDPAGNGVTGVIVAEIADFDIVVPDKELIEITNFANVDFRAIDAGTDSLKQKEIRYQQLETLLKFIEKEEPDLVILENYIMFKQQMGVHGQSFITSEMIGAIELTCRRLQIPVIKPRSSDVRQASNKMYTYTDGKTGEVKQQPAPRKIKEHLSNKAFVARGFLKRGRYNRLSLVVNGEEYELNDYKIGSKNDHILMALRHLINIVDYGKVHYKEKIDNIKQSWEETDD